MPKQLSASTKEKIMRAAAKLFSESGFSKVSTRNIASAVGINAATIYYYFPSKEEILRSLYDFYSNERLKILPNIDELLVYAEIEPVQTVLMRSIFYYGEDIREFLDQIIITATRQIESDEASKNFIQENIFEPIYLVLKPLIQRLIDLGKIEPFDLESFISVFKYYCYAAASLNNSSFGNDVARYETDVALLFSYIKPI
ncbi:MAG: TetR/AcrR family transcriptional regulator, partial [Coriobacteriales bacterium]|nr:TetR/AcrR family transcriptional regulator [Coriobacteriales bacterium]